ncbi:tetratricopeptide repeat protein [candidate division WOR-3 bacterium]|nr:tetratricopeptide repeat protein [candidate division WOR-3 bacterium]
MKCPFLIKRRDVFDNEGKRLGEEVELMACIKNECMVYDSATKLCSLLSSNMKTGILIDEYKKGVKETRDGFALDTKVLAESLLTATDKLHETIAGRLDVQKKQIEVVILGFDKLQEVYCGKFDELKAGLRGFAGEAAGRLTALDNAMTKQAGELMPMVQSLQEKLTEINNTNARFLGDLLASINSMADRFKEEISGLRTHNAEVVNNIGAKFDALSKIFAAMSEASAERYQALVEKVSSIDGVMKSAMNELRFEISTIADRFKDDLGGYLEGVKGEIVSFRNGQQAAFNNLQGESAQARTLFGRAATSLEAMSGMMDGLNKNYLESLGKIAALAEGMRKAVADIGVSMNQALRDMSGETGDRLGAVAKQYEKTLSVVGGFADRFEDMSNRLGAMTKTITDHFKESLDRQTRLTEQTGDVLEYMKSFLEKEAEHLEREQEFSRKKTALDHFDRATLYYYRGNSELALNEIEKALEIDRTAEYLNMKGLILSELGRYDESKKAFLEAIEREPELSELHNNLGLLYLKMKKVDDAVLSFEQSVKKNVGNALAYVNLGKALIEVDRFDEALAAYNHALEIDPSNREAREAVKLYEEGKIAT